MAKTGYTIEAQDGKVIVQFAGNIKIELEPMDAFHLASDLIELAKKAKRQRAT